MQFLSRHMSLFVTFTDVAGSVTDVTLTTLSLKPLLYEVGKIPMPFDNVNRAPFTLHSAFAVPRSSRIHWPIALVVRRLNLSPRGCQVRGVLSEEDCDHIIETVC